MVFKRNMDECVACAEEKLVWDCKEAGLFCNECYEQKCGGVVCINCRCIDDCECCECDEDDGKDLGEWRDIKCDDYQAEASDNESEASDNESEASDNESEDDKEDEKEDEKLERMEIEIEKDEEKRFFDKLFEKKVIEDDEPGVKVVEAKEVKADKPKCGAHKKNGDGCGFNAGENGFCKRHTPKAKVVEAKEVKADKPKCGAHKKNGDGCGFNAGENGFCKRHTPKAKVVEAKEEMWGKWDEVSDDCEEDPDFEYEYEEIWV